MEEIAEDEVNSDFSLRWEDDSHESSPPPSLSPLLKVNSHCDEDLLEKNQLHNGKTASCGTKFD